MNMESGLSRSLNFCYKSIAIFLVIFAVLLSCLRLFLPLAQDYRQELQDYINDAYQTNIVIGTLNTGWSPTGPTLIAEKLTLVNSNGAEVFVGKFEVEVDFWASIRQQRIITTDFTLNDARVFIDANRYMSESGSSSASENERSVLENLSDLFLNQIERFSIENSQVVIQLESIRRSFQIPELAWLNDGVEHKAKGEVIVDRLSSKKLKLLIDLTTDKQDELNGTAYFEANAINITPWLDRVFAIENSKTDSSINFQSWLNIKQGTPTHIQIALGENTVDWHYAEFDHQFSLQQGQLVIDIAENLEDLTIYSSDLKWRVDESDWKTSYVETHLTPEAVNGYISEIDVATVAALTPLFIEDLSTNSLIEEMQPEGLVNDIHFRYENEVELTANFAQLQSNYSQNIPSLANVSGNVALNGGQLTIAVEGHDGELDFGPHFRRPIPYQSFSSVIDLTFDDGVLLTVNDLDFRNSELSMVGDVVVDIPNDKPASMWLDADISNVDARNAKHYYPHLLMGMDLVEYLEAGIVEGEVPAAKVKFDGNFQDFPFTENPGHFSVNAELMKAKFMFDDTWPTIHKLNANLNFTNNSMMITAHSGDLTGLAVDGVKVGIADLTDAQILTVDADILEQQPEHITKLMVNSPLSDSVGAVLTDVVIGENVSGDFSLRLPLNNTDAVIAKGSIKLNDNKVELAAPAMSFSQVNGLLTFENDIVNVEALDLIWRGMPLKMKVAAADQEDFYQTTIDIAANWQEDEWMPQIPAPLQEYFAKQAKWDGQLQLFVPHTGSFSYEFALSSDLKGSQLLLPTPYEKLSDDELPLTVTAKGGLNKSKIEGELGDIASFYGDLDHSREHFNRAHLMLGAESMMLPMDGFHITTQLQQADIAEWQPFISHILDSIPDDGGAPSVNDDDKGLFGEPERIRGTVGQVTFFDAKLNDFSFNLVDKTEFWLLQANAKEARSQIKFFEAWEERGIDVNIDFLHFAEKPQSELQKVKTSKTAAQFIPAAEPDHIENSEIFKDIPNITLNCDSCRLGKLDLGKVNFSIAKIDDQRLQLKDFTAKRKGFGISLSGEWLMMEDYSSTQLAGNLDIKSLETEMDKLGFGSMVKDSGMKTSFDLNWPGGIHDYATERLHGDVSTTIDSGYLAEVTDQARIFSVLSLQSVVRKLTLDFRDIFSDGMFYSEIKGDFVIDKGIVYTNRTRMKGAAGDLVMSGNTNLVSNQLDYKMKYKPNLTSSLPVLAWIATTNPVTFLAGVAIDEVITSNVVSEFSFELTGTMDNPNLKEVDRKSQNVSVGRSSPPKIVETPKPDNQPVKVTPIDPDSTISGTI